MSLAPPVSMSRPAMNWFPLEITVFCLIWSFAFVAGKIGIGVGTGQLAAGGTTGLAVSVVDQSNNLYTAVPVTVTVIVSLPGAE